MPNSTKAEPGNIMVLIHMSTAQYVQLNYLAEPVESRVPMS